MSAAALAATAPFDLGVLPNELDRRTRGTARDRARRAGDRSDAGASNT